MICNRSFAVISMLTLGFLLSGCLPQGYRAPGGVDEAAQGVSERLDLTVGLLPITQCDGGSPSTGFNEKVAPSMDATGLFKSVEAVNAAQAGQFDLLVSVCMNMNHGFTGAAPNATVKSGYSFRELHVWQPYCGMNDPGCVNAEAIAKGLARAFAKGTGPYSELMAEIKQRRRKSGEGQLTCDDKDEITAQLEREEPEFQETLRNVHTGKVPSELPEEAHKNAVQAKFLIEQKRFRDAMDHYSSAVQAAPWWPQGHYNRSMILAKMACYEQAIREMKRYLALAPIAADAREAQDNIYGWEALVGSAEKEPSGGGE